MSYRNSLDYKIQLIFINKLSNLNQIKNSSMILKASLSTLILATLLFSCRKDSEVTNISIPKGINQDKIIPFNEAGNIHNLVLTEITSKLKGDLNSNYNAMENQAKEIAITYSLKNRMPLSSSDIENGYKLRPSIFQFRKLNMRVLQDYAGNTLSKLQSNQAITKDESEFISSIFTFLNQASGNKSSAEIHQGLDILSTIWESRHYNISTGEGIVSGYCLSIAKASASLWTNPKMLGSKKNNEMLRIKTNSYEDIPAGFNSEEIYYNPNITDGSPFFSDAIIDLDAAQIIAADIAGALGGAAGSILQDVFNHQPIDWSNAGAWAIGAGIGSSSVGGIYRVIKWLF